MLHPPTRHPPAPHNRCPPTSTRTRPAPCPQARKWFKGPVRNVDAGHKTTTLAEAAMRGELDETDSAFGNEGGEGGPEKAAQGPDLLRHLPARRA